jgi:hypothetical protein
MPIPMTLGRAIAAGGLAVGVLDGLDAIIFFGLRGTPAIRIFQSIASGLLGPAAFQGGWPAAALGVLLHFTIATVIVAVLCLAARAWPAIVDRVVPTAIAYGLGAWLVMNFVVIPLAMGARGRMIWPVVVNGLLIHVFGVGLPAVLAARAARRAVLK